MKRGNRNSKHVRPRRKPRNTKQSINYNIRNHAIGVFDSGLGGLTVVKALMKQLPFEDIVYFGDTARLPYGTKSKESIIRFSRENADVLLRHRVKIIVVACNSSSSYALPALKKDLRIPVVGVIDPGAQKAAAATRNKRVGVIATSATIGSRAYVKAVHKYAVSVHIWGQACPLFVPLVEEGWRCTPVTVAVARLYLAPLKKAGIDTLILGCTHYPLLKETIQKVMGQGVVLVDSAQEVAREVQRILEGRRWLNARLGRGRPKFMISDRPQQFEKTAKEFLGYNIRAVKI
jgi:glutamate racemase